jgi:two-component system response regulator YesN
MMAASIHVSPGYFSTLLKQETGMRFSDFVADLRIRKSKSLLLDQTLPVNEVAIKCGFSDITYFSRFLKKQTGLSPSQWRRS